MSANHWHLILFTVNRPGRGSSRYDKLCKGNTSWKNNSHANKHLSCFCTYLQNISKYFFYTANELFINRDLILQKCTQWANFSFLCLQEIFLLLLEYIYVIYIWTQKSTFPSVLWLLVKGISINRPLYNQ